jgi:hypothetical protein
VSIPTPKFFNPLSIIFTFFSFTEVMVGYGVSQTEGLIQLTLTLFVVTFPTLAAFAFFLLLWYRPRNLYAPKDFQTDEAYLKNYESEGSPSLAQLEAAIQKAVTAKLTSTELVGKVATPGDEAKVKEILRSAASDISQTIHEQQFFTVTFKAFASDIEDLTLPVDGYGTVNDLIAQLHRVLRRRVRPYYYGTDWALRDAATGRTIQTARMLAGLPPGQRLADSRTLPEIGIRPGSRVEVFKP